jgi:hypothetical protein
MARLISTALQDQLASGVIARTEMVLFDLPPPYGLVGFFSGIGTIVYSGVTFHGAGTLFDIDKIGGALDGTAVGLSVRLNGDARTDLDATALAQIESIPYQGRPFWLYRRYMHPETYAEIATELFFRGYIDVIDHNITEGGEVYLEAKVESRSLDLGRSGYRMRTDADQRQIDANDGFFRNIGTVSKREIKWANQAPWVPPPKKKKLFGIF